MHPTAQPNALIKRSLRNGGELCQLKPEQTASGGIRLLGRRGSIDGQGTRSFTARANNFGSEMHDGDSVEKIKGVLMPTPNDGFAEYLIGAMLNSRERPREFDSTFSFITQIPSRYERCTVHIPRVETPEGFTRPSNRELAEVGGLVELQWRAIRVFRVVKDTTPCSQCHNCKYFSGESLLPCAVRPMRIDEDECPDFEQETHD